MPATHPILQQLQAAANGLLFPSETDAPIEAFVWPEQTTTKATAPDEATLRANTGISEDTPLERVSLDDLAYSIPDECRPAFEPLFALLNSLTDLTVFRVGTIHIDVYLVGRTADGRFAGVKTYLVET